MKKFPSLQHLANKICVTSFGNIAKIIILGPGGLSTTYLFKPSQQDMEEVRDYLKSKLPPDLKYHELGYHGTGPVSKEKEVEAYRKFLNEED